jgi:hypothetical protein
LALVTTQKHFRSTEKVEDIIEDIVPRFVSVHGDIRELDEVIDEILGKDEKKKRRFSKG